MTADILKDMIQRVLSTIERPTDAAEATQEQQVREDLRINGLDLRNALAALSDEALALAVQRDVFFREAFDELCGRFEPRIRSWLMRSGVEYHLAFDLAQTLLLRCYMHRFRSFNPARGRVGGYLWQAARNLRAETGRSVRRQAGQLPDDFPARQPEVAEELAGREMERLVNEAVAELPEELRSVLEMHFHNRLSHAEIANRLNVTVAASQSRLFKARQVLEDRLGLSLPPSNRGRPRQLPGGADLGASVIAPILEKTMTVPNRDPQFYLTALKHLRDTEQQQGIEPLQRQQRCPQPSDLIDFARRQAGQSAASPELAWVAEHAAECIYCERALQSLQSALQKEPLSDLATDFESPVARWVMSDEPLRQHAPAAVAVESAPSPDVRAERAERVKQLRRWVKDVARTGQSAAVALVESIPAKMLEVAQGALLYRCPVPPPEWQGGNDPLAIPPTEVPLIHPDLRGDSLIIRQALEQVPSGVVNVIVVRRHGEAAEAIPPVRVPLERVQPLEGEAYWYADVPLSALVENFQPGDDLVYCVEAAPTE